MNEIVFTLVGKYEMRDANNNITESGYWNVSDSGDQISFAPKNGNPERYFDVESKNETTLTMKGSSEVTANVDNDPEPELVTVKVALELN